MAAADMDPDFVTDGAQVLKRKTTSSSGIDEVRPRCLRSPAPLPLRSTAAHPRPPLRRSA